MKKLFIILTVLLFMASIAHAQRTVIHCGTLIDGVSDRARQEMTIIVEGNRIVEVVRGYQSPVNNDRLIDLSEMTVMPGLMDMHVHLEGETSPDSYMKRFQQDPADIAYDAAVHARTTLMAGFTTVRDLGGTGVNTSLRDAINSGKMEGPRIFSAGKSIATTGGHADPTNGFRSDLAGDPGPKEGVINGPYDARKAVRQRYKNGADVIKITSTGGVLSLAKDGSGPQFTMDELEAIVSTAREYGMVTAAHAHGEEGMRRAVMAGINSIEHGTYMSESVMELMKEKGTYYVPTITAGAFVAEKAEIEGYYPPVVVPKARAIGPQILSTFAKAWEKGVKIAFGTDAGVFPHGENGREFGLMVEAGMPPMEAIKSATMEAARLLRVEDRLGSVEAGKLADIVATAENPLDNISTMEDVKFVMKDGVVCRQP